MEFSMVTPCKVVDHGMSESVQFTVPKRRGCVCSLEPFLSRDGASNFRCIEFDIDIAGDLQVSNGI